MHDNAIVFVANDVVFDQTLAFLESIAQNSRGIPLICIPYDDRTSKLDLLRRAYNFTYHSDFDFRGFMEITKILLGKQIPRLRKMGVYTVPAREFISLDTDIIVLRPLNAIFGHVGPEKSADILHFDLSPGCTYFDSTDPLIAHTKEISTGSFVSTPGIFNYSRHISTIIDNFSDFKRLANVVFDDQAFSSFVFDLERRRYVSVEKISAFSENSWYKHTYTEKDGMLINPKDGRPIAMIHYAGAADNEGYENAHAFKYLIDLYLSQGRDRLAKLGIEINSDSIATQAKAAITQNGYDDSRTLGFCKDSPFVEGGANTNARLSKLLEHCYHREDVLCKNELHNAAISREMVNLREIVKHRDATIDVLERRRNLLTGLLADHEAQVSLLQAQDFERLKMIDNLKSQIEALRASKGK